MIASISCRKRPKLRRCGVSTSRALSYVIPKDKLPGLPNSPENFEKGFVQDVSWWVNNADAMVKRFDAFLQK